MGSPQAVRAASTPTHSTSAALDAARAALASLRATLDADPGNAPLTRAVAETEGAIRLIETRPSSATR
jgi:hypothetical protein